MKSASAAAAPSVSAAGPVDADKKEGGGDGAFGLLNTVGILVGGGLGGYVFLQKTKAKVGRGGDGGGGEGYVFPQKSKADLESGGGRRGLPS